MTRLSAIRGALIAFGALLLVRAAWLAVNDIPHVDRVHVLIWFALGVVVHDGLLAPASVLLGRFALPHLPVSSRWAARALLAWVAVVAIIGLPLVRQARHRSNPTIEFGHPFVGLAVAVLVGVVAVVVTHLVLAAQSERRRARNARPADSH